MKNPRFGEQGVFQMSAFTNTFASTVNATSTPYHATKNGLRLRWCNRSNSVQSITLRKGSIHYG